MNFQTDTIASSFDANAAFTNLQSEREGQRTGGGSGFFGSLFADTTSVVGINVNEVTNMRAAINTYCEGIENYLKQLNPTADASMAFKSEEVTAALESYMESVKTYCMNLVSQLRAFSDKLADVKNQWEAYAEAMAGNINSASGAFATGSRYSETIQG